MNTLLIAPGHASTCFGTSIRRGELTNRRSVPEALPPVVERWLLSAVEVSRDDTSACLNSAQQPNAREINRPEPHIHFNFNAFALIEQSLLSVFKTKVFIFAPAKNRVLKVLRETRNIINIVIDWLYQPFRKYIRKDTFRYAACGGSNTMLDLILYAITYNFVLRKSVLDLKVVAISPHIASFLIVFPITFSTGFLLSKYITFTESELRGRIQLFRYGVTVFICIVLNYVLLKFFVELCGFYPTPSKFLTTIFVVIYSYFSQKHFTFKTTGNGNATILK